MADRSARETLIETTRALLWERGYAATSPRAILERAGVGQGSMYHHFDGKEGLAAEAFERNAHAVFERAAAVLTGRGTPVERIGTYLLLQRDALRGCPVGRMAGDAAVLESPALRSILSETFDRVRELMIAAVDEGVDAGELAADVEAAELTDAVLAVVQGGYVLARAAGDRTPFDRAVHGALTLLNHARKDSGA
jgi:AcrR family transcriptional regulator